MLDIIEEKFTEIVSNCLEKNAKKEGVLKKDMQLAFKLNSREDAEYVLYKNYQPIKVLTFLNVLGVIVDLRGYSLYVPQFISGALLRFCEENEIEKQNIRVVANFQNDKFVLWLYNHNSFVKEITIESLFNPQDVMATT
jgi:hypothetical protein